MVALGQDVLDDALAQLSGWSGDQHELQRTFDIDDAEHVNLAERAKIFADALRLRPVIRRIDGRTQIRIRDEDTGLTARQVALAARIEDAYQAVTRTRPTN